MFARSLNRREWLVATGVLAAATPLAAQSPSPGAPTIVFRYRTDPERVARMLPPPLAPADVAEVDVQAGPWGARVMVRCRYDAFEGWLPVELRLAGDEERIVARERLHLNAQPGRVEIVEEGGRIRASVLEGERAVFRLSARFPSSSSEAPATLAAPEPTFSFDARLRANWTQGVLAENRVALMRIDAPSDALPAVAGEAESAQLDWPSASALDPAVEFPVVEPLDVWRIAPTPEPSGRDVDVSVLAEVDAEDFRPWALFSYQRPITDGRAWTPKGWRREATAFRLTDDELERYRGREELVLGPLEIVEVDLMIGRDTHESLLPPPCRGAGRPMLKILGLRAGGGDLSLQPFTELWLLAFTIVVDRPAWYTVSHIVSPGGDLTYGRETFGYPSKLGDPDLMVTPIDFSLVGSRLGREFFYADGAFRGGFATGVSLAELPLAALRVRDGIGEIVYQPCFYQGRRQRADPRTVGIDFPAATAGQSNDPWHQLKPFRLGSVSVMDGAAMQRGPGEVIAEVADFERYYRERSDGLLPWEPAGDRAPTLLAGADPSSS